MRAELPQVADDNYDALLYPAGGAARDARYTRYVSEHAVLRTQTSAMIPPLLRARAPRGAHDDELLACPGLVYRRDCIDRLHTGEPHQLDLWRLARRPLGDADLDEMIALVVGVLLPGRAWRTEPAVHPYTEHGRQIDVEDDAGRWVEIGECGLAHPGVLERAGVSPSSVQGLAMGLGLDRVLMLRKGLDDIRLLRASEPRIAKQLQDLSPWRRVSRLPTVARDLSIVAAHDRTPEELGDRVRAALGDDADVVEDLTVKSETAAAELPEAARRRLGLVDGQKNVLVRLVLRPLDRTLTHEEANLLRDRAYAAIHEGPVAEWACGRPPR